MLTWDSLYISHRAYGGTRNSPVSLRPPRAPGLYEIWYLDDERKQILHRISVTITP